MESTGSCPSDRLLTDGGEDETSGDESDEQQADGDGNSGDGSGDQGDESSPATESEGETTVAFLNLEGLFLDLLGLEVDLEEVTLDVEAVRGEGNLLGNLLSAVAGLLDQGIGGGLRDLFGRLLGGLTGMSFLAGNAGDGDGESSEGSEMADRARSVTKDALDQVPVEELVNQIVTEVVRQLLDSGSDGSSATDGSSEQAESEA